MRRRFGHFRTIRALAQQTAELLLNDGSMAQAFASEVTLSFSSSLIWTALTDWENAPRWMYGICGCNWVNASDPCV